MAAPVAPPMASSAGGFGQGSADLQAARMSPAPAETTNPNSAMSLLNSPAASKFAGMTPQATDMKSQQEYKAMEDTKRASITASWDKDLRNLSGQAFLDKYKGDLTYLTPEQQQLLEKLYNRLH